MTTPNQRGGKRPGSGRKPIPGVKVNLKLAYPIFDRLNLLRGKLGKSAAVSALIANAEIPTEKQP